MNAKHTPGPWKTFPASDGSCFEVCDDDGAPVAAITPQLGDKEIANAAIIAAAPDLLAALRKIEAEARGERATTPQLRADIAEWCNAAIAKAEGV
jgi:hypothetical protein